MPHPILTTTDITRFVVTDLDKMRATARAGLASVIRDPMRISAMDDADLAEWCVDAWRTGFGPDLAHYGRLGARQGVRAGAQRRGRVAMATTTPVYPGATREELHRYLDRTYGRRHYLLTRDDEIHVLGPLPWAPEHEGWYFLEHVSALCRPQGARHAR